MANAATSKSPNISTSEDCISVGDRISTLPNRLICHILSFLPTKHAVGTCVLSTRWKFLWTSITNLDFDDTLFLHKKDALQDEEGNINFIHFVNRVVVHLNTPQIQKFSLKCGLLYDMSHISTWISVAVGRGVQELNLSLHISPEEPIHMLPYSLFTCNTLTVLKLNNDLVINISNTPVSFPSLRILHLISVRYESEDCVQKLLSSCPVIEELTIHRSNWDEVVAYNVCIPVLKRLRIYFDRDHGGVTNFSLKINCPALEYLDITDYRSSAILLENLSSLVEAVIDVNIRAIQGIDADCCDFISGILKGVSNVKILTFSSFTMEAISRATHAVPIFPNLTRLNGTFESTCWKGLAIMVENSNKLKYVNVSSD